MRRFLWVFTLPLTIVAVVFSIANRHVVSLKLWPFDIPLEMPLFLVLLASLVIGFLFGGSIALIGTARQRMRARRAERKLKLAEADNKRLRDRVERQTAQDPPPQRALPAA